MTVFKDPDNKVFDQELIVIDHLKSQEQWGDFKEDIAIIKGEDGKEYFVFADDNQMPVGICVDPELVKDITELPKLVLDQLYARRMKNGQ